MPLANIEGKVIWRWDPGGYSKIKHNRIMTMDEGEKSMVEEKVILDLSMRPAAVPFTTPEIKALIPKAPRKAAVIPKAKN